MSALTAVLGAIMLASSLGAKFVGLPRQIAENYRRKTAPQGMRWFAVLGLVSYGSQALYSSLKGYWLVAGAAAPGAVIIAVFLWQLLHYPDAG